MIEKPIRTSKTELQIILKPHHQLSVDHKILIF